MYLLAGLVYAILATLAVSSSLSVSGWVLVLFFAVTYCWPPLMAVDVAFEGRGRSRIVGGYLLVVLALAALLPLAQTSTGRIGTVPLFAWGAFIWGSLMVVPTVLLVPVLARGVRGVGPTMLNVFVVTFSLLRVALSSPGAAFGVLDRISSAVFGEVRLYIVIGLFLGLAFLVCVGVGLAAAWLIGRWHRAKRFSDLSLAVTAIVMIYTLWLLLLSSATDWRLSRFSVLLAFAAFQVTLAIQRRLDPTPGRGTRLLLLRAFHPHDGRRHRQFFRALQSEWRYVGPLQIVGGPDLATETVEPARFLRFLAGNLRSLFLADPNQVAAAIDGIDETPDPDGRYRVNELFCLGPVWRLVVAELAARSFIIVMDVSSFTGQKGLTDELHMLAQVVDLRRVTFLVGGPKEIARFRDELARAIADAPANSPNTSRALQVREISMDGRAAAVVDRVLHALDCVDETVAS